MSGPIRYAALSYCWGNEADAFAQTKTEPSNLDERLHAIPTRDMSAVIQDAVTVCRAFSVRYLWVDALCIIQDPADPSDWERESERVGQVYQHAYFTICAAASANCHQSFLDRRQQTFDFDFQSSLYPPAQGTYTLLYTGLEGWLKYYSIFEIDIRNSPWHARGWVFQEQQLSARRFLFGKHMVHFMCGAYQESENGESCGASVVDWHPTTLANYSRDKLYRDFRVCAKAYSSCILSYESDRLPALSGIAKYVFDFAGGKYLAGLWEGDLHCALLWHRSPRAGRNLAERLAMLQASTGSDAPSWSWVFQADYFEYGMPGFTVAYYLGSQLRPEYSDIDGQTLLKGAGLNPLGEVQNGRIRVRGKVLPVPADLVRIPQRIFPNHTIWRIYQHGAVVAYCVSDWASDCPRQEPGRLKMLFLSSSCDADGGLTPLYANDWSELENEKDEQEDGDEDGEEYIDEYSEEESERDSEGDSEGGGDNKQQGQKNDEEDDGEGGEDEYGVDPTEGSVSAVRTDSSGEDCVARADARMLCNNKEHNRHAWGLMIHPAEKSGEYYRVGVFLAPAGTHLFKDVEDQTIEII
jgi:hypothetical protein